MQATVVVGHVDHGKSTLLGRLLLDTGSLKQDKIASLKHLCSERGVPLEPAFLLDALAEEQAQGISIDSACIDFQYQRQRYYFIDAPGHLDFLKNMATAASRATHGLLVVDVEEGIRAQTR